MIEPQFGLIQTDDLFFLYEGTEAVCLTPGLEKLKVPTRQRRPSQCPHALLSTMPFTGEEIQNPLLQKLRPIPDGGAYHVSADALQLILQWQYLSSPTQPLIVAPWTTKITKLVPELARTNLAPLILLNSRISDMTPLMELLKLPRCRTLIFCGDLKIPGTSPLKWNGPVPARPVSGLQELHNYVADEVQRLRESQDAAAS